METKETPGWDEVQNEVMLFRERIELVVASGDM
jgi:hypothetical protein